MACHRIYALSISFLLTPIALAAPADAPDPAQLFLHDDADAIVEGRMLANPNAYDSSAASTADGLWLAWLEFVPGKGDQVWVARRDGERFDDPQCVVEPFARYAAPTLTR